MITSMTGFGSATLETDKISLSCQIKSVNGRFLEIRLRMPREYSVLENEIKKIVAASLNRGSVDISIYRTLKGKAGDVEVVPNVSLAKGWIKATQALSLETGIVGNISLDSLVRVPDVIQVCEQTEIPTWEKEAILNVVTQALKGCAGERAREGEEQVKIFTSLLDDLDIFIVSVKKKKKQLDVDLQARLSERLKAISETITIDPHRLAQEVLYLSEKADIAEELARADTHVKAYREALKGKGSMGKKLEFYTQELHREVNTMGAKTQALDVTLDVIEAKTCVERLREQVQNVE